MNHMSKLDEIIKNIRGDDYGAMNYESYDEVRAVLRKLIEEELVWGGAGGEPYPNDAEFIREEQLKRLKEL